MRTLFLQVLNMNFAAAWLILAVLCARLLLRRAPKWISVLLWGIVALRLVCPVFIESPFSLIPASPTITTVLPSFDAGQKGPVLTEALPNANTLPEDGNANQKIPAAGGQSRLHNSENSAPAGKNTLSLVDILAGVWLTGALLMAGYSAFSWLRLKRRVNTAVILRHPVYVSESISSPFVLGIIRPKIYLPCGMDENSLAYVIAHEEAHIQRKDHWWKLLGILLLSVHWFHPLVWLSYVLFCRDIELACDEKVIRALDRQQRADYSQALLLCSTAPKSIATCPPAFGEIGVKERVKSILSYKKPAFWMILTAMAVCAAVALCFLTNPASRRTLTWAQSLSPEDVRSVRLELLVGSGPQTLEGELRPQRIAAMTALLREGSGKYVSQPDDSWGGASSFFHLVLRNGTSHSIGNAGNRYLIIDGDYYEAPREYLASWEDAFPEFDQLFQSSQNAGSAGQASPGNDAIPGEASEPPSAGNDELTEDTGLLDTIILDDVDLDHDGETEKIRVYEEYEGQVYRLEVIKQDGTVIWDREAAYAHTGWSSVLLYRKDGKDYLMEYLPTMFQGVASYSCTISSLEGGRVTEEDSRTVEFSLPVLQLTGKMEAFADLVNCWLKESTVLLSTLEFKLVIGPADPTEIPEIYPVIFDPGEPDNNTLYSSLPENGLPEDVLPVKFMFASGAGAWGTELTLYPDGSFEGTYQDSEASAGPEYPNGTSYVCEFKGRFGQITRLSDYACSMRLEELTCETEENAEWIEDGVRYIGAAPYGLEQGEEFIFYMPFTPAAKLEEAFLNWWPERILYRDGTIQTLLTYAIQNVNTNDGFFASWWN